jgi:vacuolar-type H+-ATPase catalytic subunit A/Vma1
MNAIAMRTENSARVGAIIHPRETITLNGQQFNNNVSNLADAIIDAARNKAVSIIPFSEPVEVKTLNVTAVDDGLKAYFAIIGTIAVQNYCTFAELTGDDSRANFASTVQTQQAKINEVEKLQLKLDAYFKKVIDVLFYLSIEEFEKQSAYASLHLLKKYHISYKRNYNRMHTVEPFKEDESIRRNLEAGILTMEEAQSRLGVDVDQELQAAKKLEKKAPLEKLVLTTPSEDAGIVDINPRVG